MQSEADAFLHIHDTLALDGGYEQRVRTRDTISLVSLSTLQIRSNIFLAGCISCATINFLLLAVYGTLPGEGHAGSSFVMKPNGAYTTQA